MKPLLAGLLLIVCTLALPTVRAEQVTLTTGDLLIGTIQARSPQQIVLDHPVLGQLTIPTSRIQSITSEAPPPQAAASPPPASAPALVAPATAPAVMPPTALSQPSEEDSDFFAGWEGRLELGLAGSEGNTENTDFHFAFGANKKTSAERWKFAAGYNYARTGGDRTRNKAFADLTHDWLLPESAWFLFATGRYDYDEFNSYLQRLAGALGAGYNLIESETLTVVLRVGFGGNKAFRSDFEGFTPEARLGGSLEWRPAENHRITAGVTFLPDLKQTGEFRTQSQAAWIIRLDRARGLNLKLAVENEYQSARHLDAKANDLRYFTSLMWEF